MLNFFKKIFTIVLSILLIIFYNFSQIFFKICVCIFFFLKKIFKFFLGIVRFLLSPFQPKLYNCVYFLVDVILLKGLASIIIFTIAVFIIPLIRWVFKTLLFLLIGFFKKIFFFFFNKDYYNTLYFKKKFIFIKKEFYYFLILTVYDKSDFFIPKIKYWVKTGIYIYIINLILYKGIFYKLLDFLSSDNNPVLFLWDSLPIEVVNFLSGFNYDYDNVFLYIYIVFFKLGLYHYIILLFNDYNDYGLQFGLYWFDSIFLFKHNNPDFLFYRYFIDELYNIQNNISISINILLNITPPLFFFGVLFFLTVLLSWVFFSYLGLYGLYKLNLLTIFMFWLSLLYEAESILVKQKTYTIKVCNWVFLNTNNRIDYYFFIDTISFSFMLLTTTIALFVFIYAFSYFRYEPLVDRFLLFLLSFVVSMLFLVSSGNTIMLFLGWELIGFTSFCLINFWTTKTATLKSAFKAFTFNKISDFFLFIFLIASYNVYYTFDIMSLNSQIHKYEFLIVYLFGTPVNYVEFLSLMIIGASFIKSAQLGGHAWLPDSMEAPVPASSLIHSATLVSAGIYLILRFNFIFDVTQFSKFIVPIFGSLTAAYGGVCAVAQSDIKKTLAYSTISHCGFLMVLCATEMNEFTILYLYVHGFFKAGVFMCVGNILRITKGYQDTRRMGGLLKYLPFEYFCCTIGVINLAGLPFTFGFFIKHLLLLNLGNHMYIYIFVIFNSILGAFSGLFYSYRLIFYTFYDFKKGNKNLYMGLNKLNYNSQYYSNSSIAGILSIFFLFLCSYLITYFMCRFFLDGNHLFSDYTNTTILNNYYSTTNLFNGFLFNFSYINLSVLFLLITLFFSKFRRIPFFHNLINLFFKTLLGVLFFVIFYNFL